MAGIIILNQGGGAGGLLTVLYPENSEGDQIGFKQGSTTNIIQLVLTGLLSFTDTAIQPSDNFILAFMKLQAQIDGLKESVIRNNQTAAQWDSSIWIDGAIQAASLKIGGNPVFGVQSNDLVNRTANASLFVFTAVGTHTYRIGGYVKIGAVTTDVLQFIVNFNDENGTARQLNLYSAGTQALFSAVGFYGLSEIVIRVGPGSFQLSGNLTTSSGTISYDIGGLIEMIN